MVEESSIPNVQRAAILEEFGKPYVIKTDYPVTKPNELAPTECLVKLEYTGVCHSDLHVRNGDWAAKAKLPLIGGHEGIGRVVALGSEAGVNSVIKIGDRVGVKWVGKVCGRCELCRRGFEMCCPESFKHYHGFRLHGTFQEYVVSFADYVTPIPEGLDAASATPILCAGLTVYNALKQANLSVGQWVAISGAGGGLGHLAIQYAAVMGFRVLAIDTGESKKKLCLSLGAEKWVDFKEHTDLVAAVKTATDGQGPHAAVITAGDVTPFNQAVMYLRARGCLVCVGMPGGNAQLNIPLTLLIARNLTVVGSSIGTQQDAIEALQLAALGKVRCQHEVRSLEDINSAFEDLRTGAVAGRVVLRF